MITEQAMDFDLIATHDGDILITHDPAGCAPPCAVHSPSEHHMLAWPQRWHRGFRVMQRVCGHGEAHPDPDDLRVRLMPWVEWHRCDGCCVPPATEG